MINAIYFDLFFTLIVPAYEKANNEYDLLSLSVSEWEQYAENDILYHERALGFIICNDKFQLANWKTDIG